jgi:AcrR family transcriptional regulator
MYALKAGGMMIGKKRHYEQPKRVALEERYQMPIRAVVATLFIRFGTLVEVANELGVTRVTLYAWLGAKEIALLKAMAHLNLPLEVAS